MSHLDSNPQSWRIFVVQKMNKKWDQTEQTINAQMKISSC